MRPPRYHRLASQQRTTRQFAKPYVPTAVAAPSRHPLRVVADLSAKGRPVLPKSLTVQRIMGEGSFGQVFEGSMTTPAGTQRVVLKRVKTRVQGAEAMSQMEHLLNVYANRVARGHCADFLGYAEVAESEANAKLTPGLWLVWKYEGSRTLSYYLRRRDTMRALATDLQVPEPIVVPTVMKQVLEGLAAFHAAGLVHRDVKPLNMIFADDVRRFKLIDLGACADLRTGTNYVPEESILDLNFCPPEQYVLPTDSPHIAKQAGILKLAISPMLWAKHKPDRFDTWSAGIVMLQLAVPALRTDRALRNFNLVYGPKYSYDLAAWRKATHLPARDCALLDADDGAGWDLLQSLLAPRHIQVEDGGGVSFVNDTPFSRISAYEALKHRFIKAALEVPAASSQPSLASAGSLSSLSSSDTSSRRSGRQAAQEPASTSASGSGSQSGDPLSSALGIWRDVTGRLFDLEARIMRQTSATELQTTTVRRLKEQVERGRADPSVLQKEEKVLNKMQARLAGLQQDFTSTANQATGIFSFFGLGSTRQQQQPPAQPTADKAKSQALRAAEAASSASTSASSSVPSAAGMFSSVWERLGSRLADLETKVSNQASATERQSRVVRGLRAKVKAGEAEPELLSRAERTLSRMEARLLDLDRDYRAAKQNAKGALAGKVSTDSDSGRGGSGGKSVLGFTEAVAAADAALQGSQSDSEAAGSFWSRLLGPQGRGKSGGGSPEGSSTAEAAASQARGQSKAGLRPQAQAQPTPQQRQAQPQQPQAQPAAPQPGPRSLSPLFARALSPSASLQRPQQQQQKGPQPQQSGGSGTGGGYKSIFSFAAPGGGSGSSSTSSSGSASTAPPAAAAAGSSTATASGTGRGTGSAAPAGTSSGSGLFGGLFNRPKQQPQQQAQTSQSAPPQPQQQQLRQQPQASSSVSSAEGLVVPPPAAPAAASGGDALVEGASRVIRSSLGFTGLAAKIAGDMATAFKADAERYLREMELQEAAKRQQRTLDLAFLALLREAQPPVAASTTFEEAAARFAGEARWQALGPDGPGPEGAHKRELFTKYQAAALKVEQQAAAAAEAGFRAALRRFNVTATSQWEDFQTALPDSDPALAAVQDPSRRRKLFLEVVAELQLQAALQAAERRAESEFTSLLAEQKDPAVTSTSTWALVRKAVAADPRCQALPERRRRELFEAYTARLFEEESARVDLAVTAAAVADANHQREEEDNVTNKAEAEAAASAIQAPAEVAQAVSTTAATAVAAPASTASIPAAIVAPLASTAPALEPITAVAPGLEEEAVAAAASGPQQDHEPQQSRPEIIAAVTSVSLPVSAPAPAASARIEVADDEVITFIFESPNPPEAAVLSAALPEPPLAQSPAEEPLSPASFQAPLELQPSPAPDAAVAAPAATTFFGAAATTAPLPPASSEAPVSLAAVAADPSLGGGGAGTLGGMDDDDLSAALAGMEAALETALKAVTKAPPVHADLLGSTNGVNGVSINLPPLSHSLGSNGNGSGVGSQGDVAAGAAAAAGYDGVRLEELRREQARLRAEYEAMAQRLREMEERLKSQAQLMATVDHDAHLVAPPPPSTLVASASAAAGLSAADADTVLPPPDEREPEPEPSGNGEGGARAAAAVAPGLGSSSNGNGNGGGARDAVGANGGFVPARGQRWR